MVALAVTAGVAATVGASPAPGSGPREVLDTPATPPAPTPPHPAATLHTQPADVLAAATNAPSASQSVTETVQLTIIGGDLELVTPSATVALAEVPGSAREWVGTLPPLRVIDARGTGAGWTVSWAVADIEVAGSSRTERLHGATVRVTPGRPVVVDGLPDGLSAGRPHTARPGGRTLFSAAPDTGGGTYEAGGKISVRLPASVEAQQVVVSLSFSVH
jgi:hypothetical protein